MRYFVKIIMALAVISLGMAPLSSPISQEALAKEALSGMKYLEEIQDVFSDIVERVQPAVVNVSPSSTGVAAPAPRPHQRPGQKPPEAPGSGSGVIIDKEGHIITNNHVVGDAREVEIRLSDKRRFVGKVVGRDPDTDLAVIKIDSDGNLPFAPLGDSSKVKVGQYVVAVGNPYGLDRTVTVGIISALGRENVNLSRYEDFIQTDASINPGNSGGPLVNIRGEIIGINTAIINFAQGIGFAIPSSMVQTITSQLIEKGKVVRGWLGVGIQALTPELAKTFGVKEGEGVVINEVFQGDPSDKAGLSPGDIIVKVNGSAVSTPSTLSRMIAGLSPGMEAEIEVVRDGKKKVITVKLAERKEEASFASVPPPPEEVLGFSVQDLTPDLAEKFKLKEEKGVLITRVEPGSPAEAEGLREGDLLKEVNREKVTGAEEFNRVVKTIKEGEDVLLRIVRENRAFFVVLKGEQKEK